MNRILLQLVIIPLFFVLYFMGSQISCDPPTDVETVDELSYVLVQVNDPASTTAEEVTIAINPTNPLNLIAGANIDYVYTSFDGGFSWTESCLESPLGVWGDPCIVFDTLGQAYYGHLSDPPGYPWVDRIVVQKSTNGGLEWSEGIGIGHNPPRLEDKEWLGVDLTNSMYRNNLYLSWTEFDDYGNPSPDCFSRILFSYSTDSGESWSSPMTISETEGNCLDDDNTVEGVVPAVGPAGQIYLSWSGPLGIMFDRSFDGGLTFGNDIFVTDQPGGSTFSVSGIYRTNGFPVTVCDTSYSDYRGNIYILWSDQRNGPENTDIFISRSEDEGLTWSEPSLVNDDGSRRHQFFPWLTIDRTTGTLYAVFYDRRNTVGNGTEITIARSRDGGRTFQNFVLDDTLFTPRNDIFFGDYTNIAAFNGFVYPIWMRMDGPTLSIWCGIIDDSEVPD